MEYKEELKIFQININHHDLKGKSFEGIINVIINNHKSRLEIQSSHLTTEIKDEFEYRLYSYREEERDSKWADFFSQNLIRNHNFKKSHFSFVLFILTENQIYATIGGSGIRVITRFLNERFGIDLYEKFGNPILDKLISYTVRSITGVSSEKQEILNTGTSVNQVIDLTDIPTKLTIPIKQEVLNTFFSYLNLDPTSNFLEIGSYFHIKKKISFDELHEVLKNIDLINSSDHMNPISSFVKLKKTSSIIEELDDKLIDKIFDEINYIANPAIYDVYEKMDIDFLHPKNLQEFVECDEYQVFEPNKKLPFVISKNRFEIFENTLRKIAENPLNRTELKPYLRKLRMLGIRNGIRKTEAPFLNHLTTEVRLSKNYFKIDNTWYEVNDNFIFKINALSAELIKENYLEHNFLNEKWEKGVKEGDYNEKYASKKDFIVLDKILPENIEICDLIYLDHSNLKIYLIHVKNGFDAKIRDLSNQLKVASDRLFNAVNDSTEEYIFLKLLVKDYNKVNASKLKFEDFLNYLKTYKIEFVFAFKSGKKRNVDDLISKSNSNIAKYSTILCFKSIKNYPLKIFNLADIE